MAESQTMYAWMKVDELIRWCGRFYHSWDTGLADSLRDQMSLSGDVKVGSLSKGQSSKLALLLALAHRPRVVILDDPVLGLDPLARRDFLRDVIGQLQSRDVTVFFSSHLLYEIEPICDHVAILNEGRIMVSGSVDELRECVRRLEFRSLDPTIISDIPTILDVKNDGDRTWVTVANFAEANAFLDSSGLGVAAASSLNLDEIFETYVAGRTKVLT